MITFSPSQKFVRLVANAISDGIWPEILFCTIHRFSSDPSPPNAGGMVPLRSFAETKYDFRFVKPERSPKAGPVKLLTSASKMSKFEKPTRLGSVPANELLNSLISSRLDRTENSGVIDPARLFSAVNQVRQQVKKMHRTQPLTTYTCPKQLICCYCRKWQAPISTHSRLSTSQC